MLIDRVSVDALGACNRYPQRNLPDAGPVMRVDAAYDVGHRRQHQHIARSARRRHIWQDERLRFHAARIPDDRNDRCADNTFARNRCLRQLPLSWIPTASRIIRGTGQPRLHGRLRRRGRGNAKKQRHDQQKKVARLHLSTPKASSVFHKYCVSDGSTRTYCGPFRRSSKARFIPETDLTVPGQDGGAKAGSLVRRRFAFDPDWNSHGGVDTLSGCTLREADAFGQPAATYALNAVPLSVPPVSLED